MPRNDIVTVLPKTWTQLTNSDVTAMRMQSLNGNAIRLMVTATAVAPATDLGHVELNNREIIAANYTLAELWPGVTGAKRVWAWCEYYAQVSVSHA